MGAERGRWAAAACDGAGEGGLRASARPPSHVQVFQIIVFRHAAAKQGKRLRTRRRNSDFPTERRPTHKIFLAALRAAIGLAAVGNLIVHVFSTCISRIPRVRAPAIESNETRERGARRPPSLVLKRAVRGVFLAALRAAIGLAAVGNLIVHVFSTCISRIPRVRAPAIESNETRERGARRPPSLVLKRAVRGVVGSRVAPRRANKPIDPGGEMSANAGRNSENPTEHLAAKYNYLDD